MLHEAFIGSLKQKRIFRSKKKSNKHSETHFEKLTQDDDNQKSFTFYESVISMETEFELEEKNSSGAD
jgi:hypothetical protein